MLGYSGCSGDGVTVLCKALGRGEKIQTVRRCETRNMTAAGALLVCRLFGGWWRGGMDRDVHPVIGLAFERDMAVDQGENRVVAA